MKGKLPVGKPSTIGVEFATKNVELRNGGGIVKAQIWDTGTLITHYLPLFSWIRKIQSNHKRVSTFHTHIFVIIKWFSHYRRAVGALVVYDVTKEDTFINAKRWMEELRASAEPNCVIYLVGN